MTKVGEFRTGKGKRLLTIILLILVIVAHLIDTYVYELSLREYIDLTKTSTIIAIILGITFFIQHELIHLTAARILGYGKSSKLKLTSINIDTYIKKEHLIIITMSPLVIITVIYTLLALLFQEQSVIYILVVILNIVGSRNDIDQSLKSSRYKGDNIYLAGDENDSSIVYVYRKD